MKTDVMAVRALRGHVLKCIDAHRSSSLDHPIDLDVAILLGLSWIYVCSLNTSQPAYNPHCDVQAEERLFVSSYGICSARFHEPSLGYPGAPAEVHWGTLNDSNLAP